MLKTNKIFAAMFNHHGIDISFDFMVCRNHGGDDSSDSVRAVSPSHYFNFLEFLLPVHSLLLKGAQ